MGSSNLLLDITPRSPRSFPLHQLGRTLLSSFGGWKSSTSDAIVDFWSDLVVFNVVGGQRGLGEAGSGLGEAEEVKERAREVESAKAIANLSVNGGVAKAVSEEEMFRFSDLNDSNSQEAEMLESGSSVPVESQSSVYKLLQMAVKEEELDKYGSIDPPSHHVESIVGKPLFANSIIEAMGELLFRFVFVVFS
ncbi:hypothetical protein Droror1_Dr00027950 [Drosera rotundifolia]